MSAQRRGANCAPNYLPATRGGDGCPTDKVYCRTPAPVESLAIAAVTTVTVNLTTVGEAYIEELRVVVAGAADADVTIDSIRIAGREFLTDGAISAAAFSRDWPAGSNLLPTDMKITASVPAIFTITNRHATVAQDFIAVAVLREKRL